ncbi:hypothetical protein [Okeania sp. SIO1I7]|uniref:hypothetical protein n=1 Tax=Okeania sp. SIO1I7 TaxID=2607772 RepID=UPI0013FA2661|nr:hypothetical protein [Okeania sp. SIO1I7]NET26062.1 hypothetical protein [Okeania sp. SIO1I7]
MPTASSKITLVIFKKEEGRRKKEGEGGSKKEGKTLIIDIPLFEIFHKSTVVMAEEGGSKKEGRTLIIDIPLFDIFHKSIAVMIVAIYIIKW